MKKTTRLFVAGISLLITFTGCDKKSETPIDNKITIKPYSKVISQVVYYEDGRELFRNEYTYDEYGREVYQISYSNGKLNSESTDYKYDGLSREMKKLQTGQRLTINQKSLDPSFDKIVHHISRNLDDTEFENIERSFDASGRITGEVCYISGSLTDQMRDVEYKSLTCTYFVDSFIQGEQFTNKFYHEYLDSDYDKMVLSIHYDMEGRELIRQEWSYDELGRLISSAYYLSGDLMFEYKDFIYNGNECTYNEYNYTSRQRTNIFKRYIKYMEAKEIIFS